LDILQLILLGLIQGVSEFLPVSSSAHLILLPLLSDWQDQGLVLDVAAHVGTLFAVVVYFRTELRGIVYSGMTTMPWRADNHRQVINQDARLFWYLVIATIPVSVVGLLGHDFISENFRNPLVIAIATIVFGLLLWWSDKQGEKSRENCNIKLSDIIWVGFAQVLALIPGTSRSGITITAGLMLGLKRNEAARFSFLLSIPIIFLAGAYESYKFVSGSVETDIFPFIIVLVVSWLTALMTIKIFMRFIEKIGMLPFVVYRLLLGSVLLYMFV